jgi:RNA polymerase sigma factor (TIGR02999 family)
MARERPGHTLQTTALVNEAYLRLVDVRQVRWNDRTHFFAMAATVMRRILIDLSRARRNVKRGGRFRRVPLEEALDVSVRHDHDHDQDLLAIDDALSALEAFDQRKGKVVELRFFGGLTLEETAQALQVSPDTVKRDWRFAKLWLLRELSGGADDV